MSESQGFNTFEYFSWEQSINNLESNSTSGCFHNNLTINAVLISKEVFYKCPYHIPTKFASYNRLPPLVQELQFENFLICNK